MSGENPSDKEVAELVGRWHTVRDKLRNAGVSDESVAEMMRWSHPRGGVANQLRERLDELRRQERRLKDWLQQHESDVAALEDILFPSVSGNEIPLASEAALDALKKHRDLLVELRDKYAQQIASGELARFARTHEVHVVEGDNHEVRAPDDMDAGRMSVELEKAAGLLVKDTALLILLFEHFGEWPPEEAEVREAVKDLVLDDADPLHRTTVRVTKARDRWLARKPEQVTVISESVTGTKVVLKK